MKERHVQMLTVEICLGTSCHLMGNQDLMTVLDSLLPEQRRRLEVKGVTCLKNCAKGPNVKVNGVLIENTTPERLREILQENL
jgi:NADH:ubiquinone oxidoreductase subunit E